MLLLILLAVAAGAWLALDRPIPESWTHTESEPVLQMPGFLRRQDPDRLFCAESADTGNCRCITADGERPEIDPAECRRRARASETRTGAD